VPEQALHAHTPGCPHLAPVCSCPPPSEKFEVNIIYLLK
jgi:hypothetical protein